MAKIANVRLRPETSTDAPFILDLFISTRDDLLGWRDLPPAQRTELLKSQSAYQQTHYQAVYPNAWFTIVEVDEKPAGRLYVNQSSQELRIIEISLLPEYRQHGIGTTLIKNIQAEASRTKTPVRLCAEIGSEVRNFYKNLGFQEAYRDATHIHFIWNA